MSLFCTSRRDRLSLRLRWHSALRIDRVILGIAIIRQRMLALSHCLPDRQEVILLSTVIDCPEQDLNPYRPSTQRRLISTPPCILL
jgi:hypothetical protein